MQLDSAPVTCKKRLAVETYDIPKETQCSALSLEDRLLALSPIQEIFDPRTRHDFAKDRLKSVRTTSLEAVPTGSTMVNRKSLANLALSEVMLTIDIAPSAPSQDEDSAIDELSELLRKW
ncbi:hypothetical protein N0V86_006140 [Didymella sp. IMI 355093]|nr:hypothetical protein N0V86_006140 [Didymella sp. IMI 355093]